MGAASGAAARNGAVVASLAPRLPATGYRHRATVGNRWRPCRAHCYWYRSLCMPAHHPATGTSLESRWFRASEAAEFSLVSVLRHPWRPLAAASAARQHSRACRQSRPDRIDPEDRGERIEHCSQVRKSLRIRVHGKESGRGPTTVTLTSQGLRAQCQATLRPPACADRGRGGDERPVVALCRARPRRSRQRTTIASVATLGKQGRVLA